MPEENDNVKARGEEDLKIVRRQPGEIVPDGVSVSTAGRIHLKYKKTLPDGTVVRFRLAIPFVDVNWDDRDDRSEFVNSWEEKAIKVVQSWAVSELVYCKGED